LRARLRRLWRGRREDRRLRAGIRGGGEIRQACDYPRQDRRGGDHPDHDAFGVARKSDGGEGNIIACDLYYVSQGMKEQSMASRTTGHVVGPPTAPEKPAAADYENDFYSWSLEQARLLREGQWAQIDRENVAEEIESLGREQF